MSQKNIIVIVACPLGLGGRGGIDRMMAQVHQSLSNRRVEGIDILFKQSWGESVGVVSVFYFIGFLLTALLHRASGKIVILHLNVASNGSTFRKMTIATIARLVGIRYVIHLHGARFREFYAASRPFLKKRIGSFFRKSTATVVLGSPWKKFIEEEGIRTKGDLYVIPNAVGGRPDKRFTEKAVIDILFLGVIGERKGVWVLLEALSYISELPWRAVLAGNGEIAKAQEMSKTYGIDSMVTIPGWKDAESIERLLYESDILVLPSFAENLPMSVIEGMAAGAAIVTTPVGATLDIITNASNGLIVPPGSSGDLAEALKTLILDENLRRRLSVAAQSYQREKLNIEAYVTEIVSVWRDVAFAEKR